MEEYQKILIDIAGFHQIEGQDIDWRPIKLFMAKDCTTYTENRIEENFQKLDWLETYILPTLRKSYLILSEQYGHGKYELSGWDKEWVGSGSTKIEALNAALKYLVENPE